MRRHRRRVANERGHERRRGAAGGPPEQPQGPGDEERRAYGPGYRRAERPDYPDDAEGGDDRGVDDSGPGPYVGRLRRARRNDDELRRAVEAALFHDTWVDADRIRVEVRDAIVTLRGSLNDRAEIERAESHVQAVGGAREVRSELRVASRRAGDRPHGAGG